MTPIEIREKRLAYPLTVVELAERAGCAPGSIWNWEAGRRRPEPAMVRALRAVFETAPAPHLDCGGKAGGCGCNCHGRTDVRWSPEEDALLRERVEANDDLHAVARALTVAFGRLRTFEATRKRATLLGVSRYPTWHSEMEVRRLLGVSDKQTRAWRASGALRAVRDWRGVGNRPGWWRIEPADLEAFVREHAGLDLDPSRIRDRRLRELAEQAVAQRRAAS